MELSPEYVDQIKQQLLQRREILLDQRERLDDTRRSLQAEQAEPEEQARNQDERRAMATLHAMETDELILVNQALQRIDAGGFGVCKECEAPIGMARLFAIPWTPLCRDCAAAHVMEDATSETMAPTAPPTSGAPLAAEGFTPPAEFAGMDDNAKADAVRELLRGYGRAPLDSVDIEFEGGVPRVSGVLPGPDAHEALRHMLVDILGFSGIIDEIRTERPYDPPERKAPLGPADEKSDEETLLQGEDLTTDPDTAEATGEPMDPPDHLRTER